MNALQPIRIQRKRTSGWRMPPNTVYVGRPSKWANPYTVKEYGRRLALVNYRSRLNGMRLIGARAYGSLRGKNLACWCKLCNAHRDGKPLGVECPDCEPCHADILLEFANG